MALKKNGYSIQSIRSRIEYHSHNQNLHRQPKDEFVKSTVLPYTGRMASQIARIVRNGTNLEVAFHPINKISSFLTNNKYNRTDQIGVYKFPCKSCPTVYIGETGGNLPIKIAEHFRDIHFRTLHSCKRQPHSSIWCQDALLIDKEGKISHRKFKRVDQHLIFILQL